MKKAPKAASKPRPAAGAGVSPADENGGTTPIIVGLGASAGGLEALQQFVKAVPPSPGLAFVHIQHLDPMHKSMMAELLQGSTRMRVVEVRDGMKVEPDTVYIGPPDRDVAVHEGVLHLVTPAEPRLGHLAIDFFFRSLAADQGDKAICIVLSGTGTDGTLGLRAVKGAGGMTLAQEPRSAKHDGMPRSAIGTQLVDFVVTPQEMPHLLLDYVHHPYVIAPESVATTTSGQIEQIHMALREQTGHDFSHYKQNTIRRRIERRMAVHQLKRLDDYVRHIKRFPAEVEALFKDLLIGVTNFFRDPEAFHTVEEKVIPRLVEGASAPGEIRVWVPGCSTGEEAYSLAMLFAEHLDARKVARKVTIFATDIDAGAIEVARACVYPESIAADVTAERLERHFTHDGPNYRVGKRVRDMVIFAVQDVLKDPPFSRIDLVSCRNLLIYLEADLQRKLMQLFHAVLNPGGILLLGVSETVGEAAELFGQVDKKAKIYEKRPVPTHPLIGVTAINPLNEQGHPPVLRPIEPPFEAPAVEGIGEATAQILLETFAPACVVVDERYDVQYLQGRTSRFLELPPGAPQLNVLRMIRDDLGQDLRTALHRAMKERAEVVRDHVSLEGGGHVRLLVKPFRGPRAAPRLMLVAFEEVSSPGLPAAVDKEGEPVDPRVAELERKLASMKDSLQSSVEEVETSNEELRSTNEELQSANEELQSTNEELETSKEELQSVNEELMTVNNELEELSQANNDLTNLLNSTEIGTIFLDNELRIKRFTPAVAKLVNLIPTDVGRPIADMVSQVVGDDLAEHAREVLRTLSFQEAEVRTKDNRWYLRRILPYRTVDNVIDGVVVTFVSITEIREAQRMVEAMLGFADAVVNAVRQPVALLNKEGRIVQVNQAFHSMFQTRREEAMGLRLDQLDGARWGDGLKPWLEDLLAAPVDGPSPDHGPGPHETEIELRGHTKRPVRLSATRVAFGTKAVAGEEELTVITIEDSAADGAARAPGQGPPEG